ncbi:MFS transporter [Pseudooceanicola sp. CBS1P-1]|uniref:MFS transporter n=1 Tax=Pseudooceanicola albus TaxID=2692189 RepID=A0A6L7G786_9RHOB|nr:MULTISPECIES: MFS transporter [Pseudooceanicola]MBT9382982.1 MFS transporter [Pseudooceanicola endophyticus]MXN19170.1 MFS transporter [Pseudooceanicola albus]
MLALTAGKSAFAPAVVFLSLARDRVTCDAGPKGEAPRRCAPPGFHHMPVLPARRCARMPLAGGPLMAIRTPWRAVAAAMAFNGMCMGTWAARVPAVMEQHGLNKGSLGIYLLLLGIGALASFPLAGRAADKLGAGRVTNWLAFWIVGSMLFVSVAPGPVGLGVALFLFGAGHGAMDVTMNSWAAEVQRHMGRAVMSSIHAMWSVGTGTAAALGFVLVRLGTPMPLHFLIAALVMVCILLPFMRIPWVSEQRAPGKSKGKLFAIPRGALVLVGLIGLSSGLGEGAMADWSAVFLAQGIGATEAQATLGFAVFSGAMFLTRVLADRVITWAGPVPVARGGGLTAALGVAMAVLLPGLPAALAGFALMGVGYATLMPLAVSRAASDPDVPPGQALASISTLGYGAMLLGPPVIGQLSQMGSLRLAFLLLGAFALLVAVIAPVLGPARTAGSRRLA